MSDGWWAEGKGATKKEKKKRKKKGYRSGETAFDVSIDLWLRCGSSQMRLACVMCHSDTKDIAGGV